MSLFKKLSVSDILESKWCVRVRRKRDVLVANRDGEAMEDGEKGGKGAREGPGVDFIEIW